MGTRVCCAVNRQRSTENIDFVYKCVIIYLRGSPLLKQATRVRCWPFLVLRTNLLLFSKTVNIVLAKEHSFCIAD